MAGFASDVSVTQSAEFFARFGRFGGNMDKLQELLGDDTLMERWVTRIGESSPAVPLGELHELCVRGQYVANLVMERCGDSSKLRELAQGLQDAFARLGNFTLIHGVYNTTVDVLAAFKARCAAKGIDFGKFSWVSPESAPDFDLNDPETVVVLDATLDTLQNTFEFAWAWTVDGQDDKWRWDGMLSDQKKLRLLSDDRKDDAEGILPPFVKTANWG